MARKLVVLLSLLMATALPAATASARDWVYLGGNPLQHPYDPGVIRMVLHRFSVFPANVAEDLARQIIAGGGRDDTLCKGDIIAGMSFGHAEVWNEDVRIVWSNTPRDCKPILVWETTRGQAVYTAFRVLACRNLGAFHVRYRPLPAAPRAGPHFAPSPPTQCPPGLGGYTCCL